MEIGFLVNNEGTAKKLIDEALVNGLHAVIGGGQNIQIMPPLTIPYDVLDEGLDILINTINNVS